MTHIAYFNGHESTPQKAIAKALEECALLLIDIPSLVVQLENLESSGHMWDAHIRVMALKEESHAEAGRHRKQNDPGLRLEIESPEHAKSGNPNEWRPIGMRHDTPPAAFRFSNAALAGEMPNIPLQDLKLPNYELARASEPEMRRLLLQVEQLRHKIYEQLEPEPE